MTTSLIDKYDQLRYRFVKWILFGWSIWYGAFIAKDLIHNKAVFGVAILAGLTGWVLFAINIIKFARLGKRINSDNSLKEALNNELHQLYGLKSVKWGFLAVLATTCIFLAILSFRELPALIVCQLILFFGVFTTHVAWLIYNKE